MQWDQNDKIWQTFLRNADDRMEERTTLAHPHASPPWADPSKPSSSQNFQFLFAIFFKKSLTYSFRPHVLVLGAAAPSVSVDDDVLRYIVEWKKTRKIPFLTCLHQSICKQARRDNLVCPDPKCSDLFLLVPLLLYHGGNCCKTELWLIDNVSTSQTFFFVLNSGCCKKFLLPLVNLLTR